MMIAAQFANSCNQNWTRTGHTYRCAVIANLEKNKYFSRSQHEDYFPAYLLVVDRDKYERISSSEVITIGVLISAWILRSR